MKKVLVILLCFALVGCKNKSKESSVQTRAFPIVNVPGMITASEERLDYMISHYWDGFFAGNGTTNADYVLGVENGDVEQGVSNFIYLISQIPVPEAQTKVADLFSKIEKKQQEDSTSVQYLRMTEIVSRYLYNPNSPLRSEDLFLPFVEGMLASEFTQEEKRAGYEFEAQMCRLNPYGTEAADFYFFDSSGHKRSLHDIKAKFTVLFFSNPGCNACQEIITELQAFSPLDQLITKKQLAIVNIYIDSDEGAWNTYVENYPKNWINGHDRDQLINSDQLYYVRAIPSLYLLDEQKKVIYKDAPTANVLNFIANNIN